MLNHVLKCTSCGARYGFSLERKLCDKCGKGLSLEVEKLSLEERGESGIWRYAGVLPSLGSEFHISLGEGDTILQKSRRMKERLG